VLKEIQGLGEIKTFPKDPDAMQALAMGRADAWVTDKPVAIEAKNVHSKIDLQIGPSIAQMKIAMAATKGNKLLVGKINEVLKTLQKDGTYLQLSKKYFGEDISCR
jgi:polar amino acid transport system substrate-binding protein